MRLPRQSRPVTRGRLGVAVAVVAIVVDGRDRARDAGLAAAARPRQQAETIASDVVDEAIEDLGRHPRTRRSSTRRSCRRSSRSRRRGARRRRATRGPRHRRDREQARRDPHRVPRRRGRDDDPGHLRRRHQVQRRSIAEADPDNDTAVLAPKRLPQVIVPAVLGGRVQLGDEAYAVGNPLGFVDSITSGVISGLDRSVDVPTTARRCAA